MNIIQISAVKEDRIVTVYGLGDDGKVYKWANGEWKLDYVEKSKEASTFIPPHP